MRIVLDPWNSQEFRIGYSHSAMTNDERMQRESNLIATIRKTLPEFAKERADETDLVSLHQDAFAADYQEDEYLGMAIKYAGLLGKEVRVIVVNRDDYSIMKGPKESVRWAKLRSRNSKQSAWL